MNRTPAKCIAEGILALESKLLRGLKEAVIATDTTGQIIFWNEAAQALYGWDSHEVIGRNILDVTPTLESRAPAEGIFAKLAHGESWAGEFETRHKDGRRLLVEVTDYPVFDDQGNLSGVAGISRLVGGPSREALVRQVSDVSALYRLSDRLYRATSLNEVFDAALDAISETLGCRRASILLFDGSGVMRFVAARGLSEDYKRKLEGHSPWKPGEQNPEPILVTNLDETDEPDWVKAAIRKEGIQALAFIPLLVRGAVIGKFMTYYEAPHVFAEHEADLATTVAHQVAFSIERDRAEKARRRAEENLRESEERFRLMSEHAPVMIWMSDDKGACLHLNRMLRDFWGVDENSLAGFDWRDTMHPEDSSGIVEDITAALTNRSSVTIKGRYRTAGGDYRLLQTDARPRFSAGGQFLGMIGVNVDITDEERAKAALQESEARFRLAVEAAPSGMLMADAAGRIVMVNAQAEKLFGYSQSEMIGRKVETLVPDRFRASHPDYRVSYHGNPAVRPMGAGRDLFALCKDGKEIPVEIALSPVHTSEGTMVLAAVMDISARKRAEAQREFLLAELNHRVKNTIAVVLAVAKQTFKGSAASPEARKAFEGRLHALARAHDLLIQADWQNASLERLAADTVRSLAADPRRVFVSGPPIQLPPPQASSMSLALHELLTNALKYGALSNENGRVELTWHFVDEAQSTFQMVWRESGGPPVRPPDHRGFGSLLLERMLGGELGGKVSITFAPGGLVCEVTASAPLAGDS